MAGLSQALDTASWDGQDASSTELGAFSGGSQEVYLKLSNVAGDVSYTGTTTSGGITRTLEVSLDVFGKYILHTSGVLNPKKHKV